MIPFRTFLNSMFSTWIWFCTKFFLGVVVAFAIPRWLVITDGSVIIQWPLYVVGAATLIILWLISDVREEYRRRRPDSRKKKSKSNPRK